MINFVLFRIVSFWDVICSGTAVIDAAGGCALIVPLERKTTRGLEKIASQEGEKKLYGAHVRGFVDSNGGQVIDKPVDPGSGRIEWEVVLRRYDGVERQVFISSTGNANRIKSADALFNCYKSLYPAGPILEVPYSRSDSAVGSEPSDEAD